MGGGEKYERKDKEEEGLERELGRCAKGKCRDIFP